MFEILNNDMEQNLVQRQSRLKLRNNLAIPLLLCGFEIWALKQRNIDVTKD
jgi:hypothetical protein